jgi:hypothetical protein
LLVLNGATSKFVGRRNVSFLTPLGSAFNSRPSSKLNTIGEKISGSQNRTGLFGFKGEPLLILRSFLGLHNRQNFNFLIADIKINFC